MSALTLSKRESHLWEAANILRGPVDAADFNWVQHMIRSMASKTGRMAVVLPHGALFRMGKEGEIRKRLLGVDLLEAVIGLGPNLFCGAGLAACILVFRQKKAKDRKNKVLIVDASKEFKTGRAQNELLPEHVDRINGWVAAWMDSSHRVRTALNPLIPPTVKSKK